MHLLNSEVIDFIKKSDAKLDYSYEKLNILTTILQWLVYFSRLILCAGVFLFFESAKTYSWTHGIAQDVLNDVYIGTFTIILCFFVWVLSEKILKSYKRNLEVAQKFFIFLQQMENSKYSSSHSMLHDIANETVDSNNAILTTAHCVAILILLDEFEEQICFEILEGALKKLSFMEALQIKESLVCWGKARIYLELKEKELSRKFIDKFNNSNQMEKSSSEILENLYQETF